MIWNRSSRKTRAHANDLKLSEFEELDVPTWIKGKRRVCWVTLATGRIGRCSVRDRIKPPNFTSNMH